MTGDLSWYRPDSADQAKVRDICLFNLLYAATRSSIISLQISGVKLPLTRSYHMNRHTLNITTVKDHRSALLSRDIIWGIKLCILTLCHYEFSQLPFAT